MLECHRLSYPTSMRAVFAGPVVASALGLFASTAFALSLGPVTNGSRLGQPLDFAVAVKLDADESLSPQCVFADVMAGDKHVPAAQVRTRLLRGRANEAIAHVLTRTRLNEPVVSVTLSLGCPPRLSHKFVSLLDPPLAPAARAPAAATTAAATPASGASMPPAGSVERPAAAPPGDTDPARDHERLRGIDDRLEQQRAESQAAQQAIAALQARLRDLELAQRTDPVIYGLASLVVMLLIVIAMLLWRLMRTQSQQAWRQEARALAQDADSGLPSRLPSTMAPAFDDATVTSMRMVDDVARHAADEAGARQRETTSTTLPATARVRQELSAEELIDLEQQADFFIVLGQEDAAIDLLMSHVRSSGGTSPMPFLKLLEIYRRRGDADAYDRIRERFNRRFNAHAPAWDADPKGARALEDYPDVLAQVQAAWAAPRRSVELLEALLFRRDSTAETFALPAYEELLFLYAVARDALEVEINPDGVDLLLPLGQHEAVVSVQHAAGGAARPPAAAADVDVDIDLDHSPRPRRGA